MKHAVNVGQSLSHRGMGTPITYLPPEATSECRGRIGPVTVVRWGDGVWQARTAGYNGGYRRTLRAALGSLLDVIGNPEAVSAYEASPAPADKGYIGADGIGVFDGGGALELDDASYEIITALRQQKSVTMRPRWKGYCEPWDEEITRESR